MPENRGPRFSSALRSGQVDMGALGAILPTLSFANYLCYTPTNRATPPSPQQQWAKYDQLESLTGSGL